MWTFAAKACGSVFILWGSCISTTFSYGSGLQFSETSSWAKVVVRHPVYTKYAIWPEVVKISSFRQMCWTDGETDKQTNRWLDGKKQNKTLKSLAEDKTHQWLFYLLVGFCWNWMHLITVSVQKGTRNDRAEAERRGMKFVQSFFCHTQYPGHTGYSHSKWLALTQEETIITARNKVTQ